MLYNPPSGSTDANAKFVGKNTSAGQQGSKVPAMAIEAPQRELVALIQGAGLGPTNDDLTQVLQAVKALAKTGTATVLTTRSIAGRSPAQYTTPGAYALIIPAGTPFEVSDCRGGGGGGGGAAGMTYAGSGGGGAGNVKKTCLAVTDTTLAITVGSGGLGGVGGASPGNGTAGGSSTIVIQVGRVTDLAGKTFEAGATLCTALGGGFGYAAQPNGVFTSNQVGSGGLATGGDINDNGDSGGFPINYAGGSAPQGGPGGASPGSGAAPTANVGGQGNTSSAPGVGGNGSSANAAGGAGSPGRVVIYR